VVGEECIFHFRVSTGRPYQSITLTNLSSGRSSAQQYIDTRRKVSSWNFGAGHKNEKHPSRNYVEFFGFKKVQNKALLQQSARNETLENMGSIMSGRTSGQCESDSVVLP
jgi:hypothetical protein